MSRRDLNDGPSKRDRGGAMWAVAGFTAMALLGVAIAAYLTPGESSDRQLDEAAAVPMPASPDPVGVPPPTPLDERMAGAEQPTAKRISLDRDDLNLGVKTLPKLGSEPTGSAPAGSARASGSQLTHVGAAAAQRPGPGDTETRARRQRIGARHRNMELEQALGDVPVTMYGASWCGVCRRASTWLAGRGVRATEIDIDRASSEQLARFRSLSPRGSIPAIVVDGSEVMLGLSEARLESALLNAADRRLSR